MIDAENDDCPDTKYFDVGIVALGYERRCRFVADRFKIDARHKVALKFGFLESASYEENRIYFEGTRWSIHDHDDLAIYERLINNVAELAKSGVVPKLFVDISSMSREMMSKIALMIETMRTSTQVFVTVAYAPSDFEGKYDAAPIRSNGPMHRSLAGWSSRPDKPLGVVMGLGCEPGLALGALQYLEPNKAWAFSAKGFDSSFEHALIEANQNISTIFDLTMFSYSIENPTITRGKIEALINAIEESYRIICIPFGPKILAWLMLGTVIFNSKRQTGIWAFSAKEQARAVDRSASGEVIWYNSLVCPD